VISTFAARAAAVSAFSFAGLLGYTAVFRDSSVFEGVSAVRLILTALFVAICVAYLVWLRKTLSSAEPERPTFVRTVAPGWPFLVAALLSPPISSDPLLYLHYGAMALRGVNPYLVPSDALATPFSSFVVWYQTCVYGPIALLTYAFSALTQSPVAGVLTLKLLWLCAHLLAGYACFSANVERRTWLTRAFVYNPILLLAFVVDAHVDALVAAWLLWGFVALLRDRARVSLLLLVLATLTKSVALLALPLWFAWALSRRRYALLPFGVALLGGTVLVLWFVLFPTGAAWLSLVNPVPNTGRSIQHALTLSGSSFGFDGPAAARVYSSLARGVFIGGAAALWLRAVNARPYDALALARDFALLLLFACLFVVPFVPWWYSSLVVAAVLFSPRASLIWPSAMTYAVCATITLSAGSGLSKAGLVSAALAIVPCTLMLTWAARRRLRWSWAVEP
jgi:alpha-1,6-mannosyltransferase